MKKAKRMALTALGSILALATVGASAEHPVATAQLPSPATATPSTTLLARLVGGAQVGHPEPTPVAGIFRVKIGSDYVYLTSDGKHAFTGNLFDLSTGENLTETRRNTDRLDMLSAFPEEDLLRFPAEGKEQTRILVFTDATCPYCRKLHEEVPALRKAGVTIGYIPFPRGGKGSPGDHAALGLVRRGPA